MSPDQEQFYNDVIFLVHRGGGAVISPPDKWPVIFECALTSRLPQDLAYVADQKLDGLELSLIGTDQVDVHRYSVGPKSIAVPQD
jgi:hypothetical protein